MRWRSRSRPRKRSRRECCRRSPTLLEPVLTIHVTVPDSYTGDVMSDLNGKRAHVSGMTPGSNGYTVIDATVPAAEVQRYTTDLRSITQGRGSFTTEFSALPAGAAARGRADQGGAPNNTRAPRPEINLRKLSDR